MDREDFLRLLQQMGEELYRDMPWRSDTRPYYVLVSELMLQQTQVDRVVPKFQQFVLAFPDEQVLARATLADVLRHWQGLGYNRRAKFLHDAAKQIVAQGFFPDDEQGLTTLPGIGKNTAGAIMAYAFNQPTFFIETNIRAVYIHHFFADQDAVDDIDILACMQATAPWLSADKTVSHEAGMQLSPRTFYWALMDYGSWLKKQGVRPNRSRHYKKQPPLSGSVREVRGLIIAALSKSHLTTEKLRDVVAADDRFSPAIDGLMRDGLVIKTKGYFHLTK